MAARVVTVAVMTPFILAFSPWLVGALIGAIVAGVLTRRQPAWYDAIVHCVGSSYVGASVAALVSPRPVITAAHFGFVHLLLFWLVIPVLFGSVAALVPNRRE